jgi:hypothetical protein
MTDQGYRLAVLVMLGVLIAVNIYAVTVLADIERSLEYTLPVEVMNGYTDPIPVSPQ